ncbi:MAG: hypothetical protein Q4G68_13780 [Planctomycetia bacterium]|nr:hypothetical protein [Planctomycetia bacterium]
MAPIYAEGGFREYLLSGETFNKTEVNSSAAATSGVTAGWSELFESQGISWRRLYRDGEVDVLDQSRSEQSRHTGRMAEHCLLEFHSEGVFVLGHYVDYPIVSNETNPTLWLRSDRPGATLAALVVLPQTIRPDTGTPLTLLIRGATYYQTGSWEKLAFTRGMRRPFQNEIQALRSQEKLTINPEGAYIRQIIILVEGSSGQCSLEIDDLQIGEYLPTPYSQLLTSERNNRFDPVNLLAFRLAVSDVPLFPDTEQATSDYLGREPFGIDALHENVLADRAHYRAVETESPFGDIRKEFYANVQRYEDLVHGPLADSPFTDMIAAGDARFDIHQVNWSTPVPPTISGLGTPNANLADTSVTPHAEAAVPDASVDIILGSGTLESPQDAEVYTVAQSTRPASLEVRFRGRYLTVNKQTSYGVRALEYQGEPLAFVKELGFNAIWVRHAPDAKLLQEAKQTGIWLICAVPVGSETVSSGTGFGQNLPAASATGTLPYFNRTPVGPDYDQVLVWDLGAHVRRDEFDRIRESVRMIRSLDPHGRPVVCQLDSGLGEYTFRNDLDGVWLARAPLLSSLDLADYGQWLLRYPSMATPDFPVWNRIQTQADMELLAQSRFFGAVDEMPALISYEQIRQQVRLSQAAGCHGLLFASDAPLNGLDHETQYRAAACELVNLELILTEPWFAGGHSEEMITSNKPDLSAVVQKTKRTGILLPVSSCENDQYVMGETAANNLRFIAPVRDGYDAELLVPGMMRKIPSSRKAGGVHLELEEASMNSIIFLTQSEWYNQVMSDTVPKFGPRMAELAIKLAKMRIDTFEKTLYELKYLQENDNIPTSNGKPLLALNDLTTLISQSKQGTDAAEKFLTENDYSQAYLQAERASRGIRLMERKLWSEATRNEINRPVLPVSVSFAMLPAYLIAYGRINSQEIKLTGDNLIQGGNMEDPAAWTHGNWTRYEAPVPATRVIVSRDAQSARAGSFGLHLGTLQEGNEIPVEMESPPVWIEVPIQVRTGQMICVQGWLALPGDLTHTTDGLKIYDDHGGEALALRFKEQTPWRRFAFYRYAAFDGEMKIRFSLSGYGEVWLDEISAYIVQ